jgi:hypothetical protein
MDSKDNELTEWSDTEFRSIWSKLIHDIKEDSNKGISAVRNHSGLRQESQQHR